MAQKKIIKKSALTPTVLIAGGAGFIGSNLAETLLLQNARVVVLDNFSTGKDVYVSSLLNNPKFALFNTDINKGLPEEIESVDYIFHLAGVETYLSGHDEVSLNSLLTNSLGTKNLLDLANKSNAKFLLVSSTNIYQGMMSSLNLDRYFGSTKQEERKYSLAEAKRYAEALVGEYYKRYRTDVRIARIPEVYGPRMDLSSGGPLSAFLKDLLEDKDLTLYGEGTEKEYYVYITDAVSGIVKALFKEHTEGKIYSLVGEEPFTTLELAYLLKSVAHREININFKSKSKTFEAANTAPDTSNLNEIDWEAKTALKEGIAKTLKWFGYETNEHSFKPGHIIAKKEQEKQATESIVNLGEDIKKPKIHIDLKDSFLKFGNKVDSIVQEVQDHNPLQQIVDNTKHTEVEIEKTLNSKLSKKATIAYALTAILIAFLIFVGLPSIQTYVYLRGAQRELEKVPTEITQLDSAGAANASNETFKKLVKAQAAFRRLRWAFAVTQQTEKYEIAQNLLGSAKYFSKATYNTAKAVAPFESIVQVLRPDSEEVIQEDQIQESQLYLSNAKNDLQLAEAEFKKVDIEKIPLAQKEKVNFYEEKLNTAIESVGIAEALAADLPNLIGLDAPRKYLILFQNSNEIRATGGFIGSYAVLEIDKGKITSLTIDDIYNPDGQIDVRDIIVNAPEAVITYLDEDRMHIRNANWDPDFTDTATDIQNLFFKIDGSSFNGVIAVDLFFAKNILNVTGPIFLTAYNEEITADNLYERTQFHSEFNYQEGVSQKKSFLTVLGSKLLEKLFALPQEKMTLLATELNNSLREKHMLMYLNNSSFGSVLDKQNWDGRLANVDSDYLYVVNSNVGGTKSNYYVENSMNYKVTSQTRDGILRAELTLNYKHNGEDYAWPGGPYTNYLRVITQTGTKLTGAKLIKNGKEVEKEVIGPLTEEDTEKANDVTLLEAGNIFADIIISKEDGYDVFEIPFTVLPQEEVQVVLEYDLPKSIALTKEDKTYELYWQKQPGTNKDETNFEFDYPLGLEVETTIPQMELSEGKVLFSDKLDTDKKYGIKLK